jgi:hypothetical protein
LPLVLNGIIGEDGELGLALLARALDFVHGRMKASGAYADLPPVTFLWQAWLVHAYWSVQAAGQQKELRQLRAEASGRAVAHWLAIRYGATTPDGVEALVSAVRAGAPASR